MNLIPAAVMKSIKRTLQKIMKWLAIDDLGAKRPFKSLLVGAFFFTGFLPMMTYLIFASVVVCLGVFLWIVIEGGILAVATITLMAVLIIPACIAGGLALVSYTVYSVYLQIKRLLESVVNVQPKLVSGDAGFKKEVKGEWSDEKPEFFGKAPFMRGKKALKDASKDSDGEADDANETRSTFQLGDQPKVSA